MKQWYVLHLGWIRVKRGVCGRGPEIWTVETGRLLRLAGRNKIIAWCARELWLKGCSVYHWVSGHVGKCTNDDGDWDIGRMERGWDDDDGGWEMDAKCWCCQAVAIELVEPE